MAAVLPHASEPLEDMEPSALDLADPLGIRAGRASRFEWLAKMKVDTQIGTIWLGFWGVASLAFFMLGAGIALLGALDQMHGSIFLVLKYWGNVQVAPPEGHLALARSLRGGGYWQINLVFWVLAVACWAVRCYERLVRHKWRPFLFFAWFSAIFLTTIIWVIHPLLVGSWADAPALGLNSDLQWAQNFSVLWGDLYYNPFHQLAIFFLFGSTMLWGMHGATILATSAEGSHHEDAECKNLTSGSQKAMLFWRWTMGFNAFPKSIHDWLWWFSVGVVLSSGIGILATGTMTNNWYAWGVDHGTVVQYGPMTRSAINQHPIPMPPMHGIQNYQPAQTSTNHV